MYGFHSAADFPANLAELTEIWELRTLDGALVPLDEWPFPSIKRGEHVVNREYKVRRKDIDWERIFSYSGANPPYAAGHRLAFLSVRDITERRRAEEALRASEAKLRTAQRIAKLGSWELSLLDDRICLSDEARRILGMDLSSGEICLDEILDRVHPDDRDSVIFAQDAAVAGLAHFDVEHRILLADGTVKMVHNLADVLRGENGMPIGLSGTILDITERSDLQIQLLQAQKMEAVGRLSGGVAHDFNNALAVIGGYTELLLEECLVGDEVGKEYVGRIQAAHERARTLTKQLLAFSRKQPLKPTHLEVNAIVASLEEMLARLIGEDIRLTVECDPISLVAEADKGQIEQVVMNLVVNARDAMPKGGELTIRTAQVSIDGRQSGSHPPMKPGKYAMLRVRDTGCGMDGATRARIFEPFFTTKESGQGTGLGLSTVYGIVTQCGGTVAVDSSPGGGSTFSVYLPIKSLAAPQEASAGLEPTRGRGSQTILLVEDEESMRTLLSHALQSHGYQVQVARDGAEALRLASECPTPIDLLLSDVILPGISGPEIGRKLQGSRPAIHQLFMSGYTQDYIARSQDEDSSLALIDKPFSMEALLTKIQSVLTQPARAA